MCVYVEHRTLKTGLEKFYVLFFNSDFSFNIRSIPTKFLGGVLNHTPKGRVSQKFDLGPGYFFMLCRKFGKLFFHYYLRSVS